MRMRLLEQCGQAALKNLGVHDLPTRPLKGELVLLQEEEGGERCQFRVAEAVHNVRHPDGDNSDDAFQLVLSRILTDSQMSRQVELYFLAAGGGRQSRLFTGPG